MKPELERYLDKASVNLTLARSLLADDWPDEAGRASYFAAFHAAQALLFGRRRKVARTHRGVQAGLIEETTDDPEWDRDLRGFLGRGFGYKTTADYAIDPALSITSDQAAAAIATAERFLVVVRAQLERLP